VPIEPLPVVKGHAYGNDFLLVSEEALGDRRPSELARAICHPHTGIGADGLILFMPEPGGASMRLFNPDGGRVEVSGNGIRCLAALLQRDHGGDAELCIRTASGPKRLTRLDRDGSRWRFLARMGAPSAIRSLEFEVSGERMTVISLWMGNPQCVLLGADPDPGRFQALGRALATHPAFPDGTNVEFAVVDRPDRVRIQIWERGVGPTSSSGTGSCAAAVAAATFGGADRAVDVVAPGGTQRVEWAPDGDVLLTGWAELLLEGSWLPG
jgi:diaminopimelate epimerase